MSGRRRRLRCRYCPWRCHLPGFKHMLARGRCHGLPTSRRKHVRCRIKHLRATPTTNPAARYFELIGDDFKNSFAGRATRVEAHDRVIVGRSSAFSECRGHQNPAVFTVRHGQLAVRRIGGFEFIGLTLQNASQHQGATACHPGTQERRQYFQWRCQNIG